MSKIHPFYCQHCRRYGRRSTTVDGVVVKEKKVLLLKRVISPQVGTWTLSGGFVKLTETTEEAVIREVKEETGLRTEIDKLVGVFSNPARDTRHCITVAYLLKVLGGKERVNEESRQIQWFDLSNLPENVGFDHAEIVNTAAKLLETNF